MHWILVSCLCGGIAMSNMFSSGKPAGTVTQTQTSTPSSLVTPYLNQVFTGAQNAYAQGVSPYATQAAQTYASAATDPNSPTNAASGAVKNILSPEYLNPATNPAFSAAIKDALGQAGTAIEGQYGGAAGTNLGNSGYQENLGRGLGAAATNAYANQYNQNASHQLQAASLAPGLNAANPALMAQAGQIGNANLWGPTQAYGSLVNGLADASGKTVSNQVPYFTQPLLSLLGGAAGLSGLSGALFGSPAAGAATSGILGSGGIGNVFSGLGNLWGGSQAALNNGLANFSGMNPGVANYGFKGDTAPVAGNTGISVPDWFGADPTSAQAALSGFAANNPGLANLGFTGGGGLPGGTGINVPDWFGSFDGGSGAAAATPAAGGIPVAEPTAIDLSNASALGPDASGFSFAGGPAAIAAITASILGSDIFGSDAGDIPDSYYTSRGTTREAVQQASQRQIAQLLAANPSLLYAG